MTTPFQIVIDKETIERQLVDAIAKSALGDQITKAMEKVFTEKTEGSGFDKKTMVEAAIHNVVSRKITEVLTQEINTRVEAIRAQLAAKLTDEVIESFISEAWKKFNNRY